MIQSIRLSISETSYSINSHRNHTKHQRQDRSPNPYNPNSVVAAHIEIFHVKERLVYMRLIRSIYDWIPVIDSDDLSRCELFQTS